MADVFTKAKRSEIMSRIKGKNTAPELAVRQALWRRGVRYRVHVRTVHGTPDIVHSTARVAVFIDGYFWHGCPACYMAPVANRTFWRRKLKVNRLRRVQVLEDLRAERWTVLEFWQCRVGRNLDSVVKRIESAIRRKASSRRLTS